MGRLRPFVWTALFLATTAHAQERPSLAFLDVPDRPDDDRPRADAEDVHALEELEGELARFDRSARDYQRTIDALVTRRLRERQRALIAHYGRQLRTERALELRARERAAAELEAFLRRHPSADEHRPDAMLRLAELRYLEAIDEMERTGAERADFSAPIALARAILREHPHHRAIDRAAYLAGYGLLEMGQAEEALAVWRGLVCANRYGFERAAAEPAPLPHPALPRAVDTADPYEGCTPVLASPLLTEIWLRIGEHHFEAPGELAHALGAYRRVLSDADDPLYGFGLYKLAWTYYRTDRFAEAVEHFGALVEWSDRRFRITGRAGSELRAEALQYIAIALAYDDWDEDGRPDHTAGGPTPMMRLTSLLPDRPWARDAYEATARTFYAEARYEEAVLAWRAMIARWPRHCDQTEILLSIARAERRMHDEEGAFATLSEIPASIEAGFDHCSIEEQRRAEAIAERAMHAIAVLHHQRAQDLRRRGEPAVDAYALAVRAYRLELERYPNSPRAYSITYDMADALYWSERYREAAQSYERVRDSQVDDRLFAQSARRAVESYRRMLEVEGIAERTEPPVEGRAVTATAVPDALQRVARAREIYVRWVDEAEDVERVRDAYAYNNALLLYRYGFWPEAGARLRAIFDARCRSAAASELAGHAWRVMRSMATALDDAAELDRLAADARGGSCPVDRSLEEDLDGLDLQRLVRQVRALEGQPDSPERRGRAEQIADRLVAIVDGDPRGEDRWLALQQAALALRAYALHPAAAERLYSRIVDEASGDARAEVDAILADAHFQIARIAHSSFDVDRALAGYSAIASSPRFSRSNDPIVRELRRDALVNAAVLASQAGRHEAAAQAWARAAPVLAANERREALLRSAEETLEAGDVRAAARALDVWLRANATDDALAVRANVARARAAERIGDRAAELRALEAAGRSRALPELGAPAALTLADRRASSYRVAPIRIAPQANAVAARAELDRRVREESARLRPLLDAYEAVIAHGRAAESTEALTRQGALIEGLVRAVLEAEVAVPRDLARIIQRASPSARTDLTERWNDVIRQGLDDQVRTVECRAIERYLLAIRLARRDGRDAPAAIARLRAYGEEHVRECVRAAIERDPTFAPLGDGELDRARPGMAAPGDIGAPPLAR